MMSLFDRKQYVAVCLSQTVTNYLTIKLANIIILISSPLTSDENLWLTVDDKYWLIIALIENNIVENDLVVSKLFVYC